MFGKKKEQQPRPDSEHTKELKAIWENLDQDLKDFALKTRDLGFGYNLKTRFNQQGMARLVKQLDEIGYEIKPQEDHEDEQ